MTTISTPNRLSTATIDRAAGVLLAQAVGDALGVPYEFGTPPHRPGVLAEMRGGGLGQCAAGEWPDDTHMATCLALVAATGAGRSCVDAADDGRGRLRTLVRRQTRRHRDPDEFRAVLRIGMHPPAS